MNCTCGCPDTAHEAPDLQNAGKCTMCNCPAYTAPGSMRAMYSRACLECKYSWQAPSPKGNCPKCRSDKTETIGLRNNSLKRI